MKMKYIAALCACFMIAACGKSSSNEADQKNLDTDVTSSDFCSNSDNYYSSTCSNIRQDGLNAGLSPYFGGGTSNYSDSAFNQSASSCGCKNGERLVTINGVDLCESIVTSESFSNEVYMKLTVRPNGRRVLRASTGSYSDRQAGPRYTDPESCSGGASGARCLSQNECNDLRDGGTNGIIQAQCVPVPNQNYGYCQRN